MCLNVIYPPESDGSFKRSAFKSPLHGRESDSRFLSQRFDFIRSEHTTVDFKAFLGKDSHTSWDHERAGDAGVEGGELESVLFREGEKVGVGGVFGVSAPGGERAAGWEIVGEEAVACVQVVHEFV
jgi:hypothetical protein